jgi:hypothetical protein
MKDKRAFIEKNYKILKSIYIDNINNQPEDGFYSTTDIDYGDTNPYWNHRVYLGTDISDSVFNETENFFNEKEYKPTIYVDNIENINIPKDYNKNFTEKFKESLFSGVLTGCLMGIVYTLGWISPILWGGNALFFPALVAGIISSIIYNGELKLWILGAFSGLISSIPVIIGSTVLFINTGFVDPTAIIITILSSIVLGSLGSFITYLISEFNVLK